MGGDSPRLHPRNRRRSKHAIVIVAWRCLLYACDGPSFSCPASLGSSSQSPAATWYRHPSREALCLVIVERQSAQLSETLTPPRRSLTNGRTCFLGSFEIHQALFR